MRIVRPASCLWRGRAVVHAGRVRRMEPLSGLSSQAREIITATHDGDDLAWEHLRLIEAAVNGFLNEAGLQSFARLHAEVVSGEYRRPWFKGIAHLTLHPAGFVLWKGQTVEHFELSYAYSGRSTAYATELARRCAILEASGATPTVSTVLCTWQEPTT
jgi:hypothetical protein